MDANSSNVLNNEEIIVQGGQGAPQVHRIEDLNTSNILNRTTFRSRNVLKTSTLKVLNNEIKKVMVNLGEEALTEDALRKVVVTLIEAYNGLADSYEKSMGFILQWSGETNGDITNLQNAFNSQVDRIELVIRKVDEAMINFAKNLAEITAALARVNVVPNIQQQRVEYAGAFNDINFNNSFGSYNENNNLFNNNLINNNLTNNNLLNNNVANNQNFNMNANAGISANLVMQGGRNGDLLQGNLIADDNNAVKLFLEESVVLENQNILGNIVVQRDSGRQALYTLRNHQNRLVFRMLQREPTQSEIGEHRCFFRKVISPNEDIAYEVAYKANNFDMKTFVSGRIGNAKSKFNPKKAGDGRAKDYYYTFKYNSTQIQFLRKINKERERFNMKTFFLNNGDDKFSIYVNKRNGPSGRYDKKQGADTRSFNTPAYKQNFVQYIPIIPQTNRGYEPINYGRPLNNGFRGKRGPTNNGRFVGNSRFGPKESFGGSPNGRSMFVKPNGFNGDYDKNMRSYPARGGYGTQFTGSGQFNRPRGGYGYNSQQNGRFNEYGRRFMDFDSGSRGYQGFMRSSRY